MPPSISKATRKWTSWSLLARCCLLISCCCLLVHGFSIPPSRGMVIPTFLVPFSLLQQQHQQQQQQQQQRSRTTATTTTSRTFSLPTKSKSKITTATTTTTTTTTLHESATEPEVQDMLTGHVNGVHDDAGHVHGDSSHNGYPLQHPKPLQQQQVDGEDANTNDVEVPRPTQKGGYSHTAASRAKIAAANKGKTPWNKGRERPPEVKARIAAGVRAKNRQRFLQTLADQGLSEQEYEKQQVDKQQKQEAERMTRRTDKGGYRPTEETKTKISNILKEKYANGEINRKPRDPSTIRRGFTHSEETRQKISESLRQRWASDPEYRLKMTQAATNANTKEEVRNKISTSLKLKWKDPEFRAEMLDKISNRKSPTGYGDTHREAISRAMKKKWQNQEYRKKTLEGIGKKQAELAKARPVKPKQPKKTVRAKKPLKGSSSSSPKKRDVVRLVQPLSAEDVGKQQQQQHKKKQVKKKSKRKKSPLILDSDEEATVVAAKTIAKGAPKRKKAVAKKKEKKEPDGSVNRLREERRDLFDLLYGDEDNDDDNDDDNDNDEDDNDDDDENQVGTGFIDLDLGDEDLDAFDPYGLENF